MLCIGDLMLDDFVYGEVSRISPEAPAPVHCGQAQRESRSAAPATSRATSPRSARAASSSASSATMTPAASADRAAFAEAEPLIEPASGGRSGAADHAQGALRLRASSRPICCAPTGSSRRRSSAEIEGKLLIARALAALPRVGAWCCPTTPRAC